MLSGEALQSAVWGRRYLARSALGGAVCELREALGDDSRQPRFVETVAKVSGQGAASCFSCGCGETCGVGVPRLLFGKSVKITEDMIPRVTKSPETLKAAVDAGRSWAAACGTGTIARRSPGGCRRS